MNLLPYILLFIGAVCFYTIMSYRQRQRLKQAKEEYKQLKKTTVIYMGHERSGVRRKRT